jgi:hypothetical protein
MLPIAPDKVGWVKSHLLKSDAPDGIESAEMVLLRSALAPDPPGFESADRLGFENGLGILFRSVAVDAPDTPDKVGGSKAIC